MTRTEELIDQHFHKKPGENIPTLYDRYEKISAFHSDPLTAAILASSYYGMEELVMRLPRLNDMLRNPFSDEERLHAITGLIMAADGGPAEGAKAIQLYMALKAGDCMPEDVKAYHLLSLLSIACRQARPLSEELIQNMQDSGASFHEAAMEWLKKEQKEAELLAQEDSMAYALLVGMKEEVETIFDEEL